MARMEQDQCVKQMGDPSHLSDLSTGLNQLRQQAAFCDVTIIVGDQRFPAHKAVLSCASNYFQGMFSSGFQESTMSEITVPGTEEIFAQILDFAYTGHFILSIRTVIGILKMASYMVLTKAIESCAAYLKDVKDNLTVEDCFEIWTIASNHDSLSDVAEMYRSHVIQNFAKCVKSEVFLQNSTASVMQDIISDEEIETDTVTEEQILQGVVTWLKYDWEQRKVHAVDLLKKIRLGLVPVDRLKETLGDELLAAISECKDMVEKAIMLNVTTDAASSLPLNQSQPELFASRNTITAKLGICYPGFKSHSLISLMCSTEAACFKLTKFADIVCPCFEMGQPHPDGICIFVCKEGHLYAAGGREWLVQQDLELEELYETWVSTNNFFRYSSEKNEWIMLPPMPRLLYEPNIFQVDEYIYLLGTCLEVPAIERYCIHSNTWEIVKDDLFLEPYNARQVLNQDILLWGQVNIENANDEDDVFKVALYRPASNELVEVSVDRRVDIDSRFEVHGSIWYLVTRHHQQLDQVRRCVCDFDSDSPSIVVKEVVSGELYRIIEEWDGFKMFTFDKRNLGMIQVPCKCASHNKDKSAK